jgi:hypothetical protein
LKQMLQQPAAPQQAAAPRPQGMPPGMPQGVPQGMPQAAPPQGMPPVQAARGGHIAQLMSNLGRNYGSGGIIAFARGGDEGLDEEQRDKLRRLEAAYDPALTEQLIAGNTRQPSMPAEVLAGARDILGRNVTTTPEQLKRERVSDYDTTVGTPNLEVFNRAAQELENRKKQFEGPKEGMPALMEYLQQIALAPKGVGSLTAGAMGAQKINEMKQAREQQQFDLNTKILDIEQKKIDSLRTYAKEKFNIGDTAFNQMFKANLDAARQVTQNDMDAEKLAAQKTEAQLRHEAEKERNANQAAANANTAAYHAADLALKGRQQDLNELVKPTAEDINFNRIMGKVNQDPEIKAMAKRLSDYEPGSDEYRQVQKMMYAKTKTYFSQHPNLLPPLSEVADMPAPKKEDDLHWWQFRSKAEREKKKANTIPPEWSVTPIKVD